MISNALTANALSWTRLIGANATLKVVILLAFHGFPPRKKLNIQFLNL